MKKIKKIIPYGRQSIDSKDIKSVLTTLKSDYLTTGPKAKIFEKIFEKKINVKHAITCSNGTAALHLAFLSIGLGKNDVVVLPVVNFIASVNISHILGAKIYFADVDSKTGQMTPEKLNQCIKFYDLKKIKAVVTMYNGGCPNNAKEFLKLKNKYKFYLIEDACHALGAKYSIKNKELVGSCKYSDISTFSFHPVKSITTGEGGMVTTNNKKIFEKINLLKNHGIVRKKSNNKNYFWSYKVVIPGYNYRLSEINCSLGISQLEKIEGFINIRQKIFKLYNQKLKHLKNKIVLPINFEDQKSAHHLYVICLNTDKVKISRNKLIKELYKYGITTQVHYIPVHHQPFYKKYSKYDFPDAEKYYDSCLSLPIYPKLSKKKIIYICNVIQKLLN